MKQESLQRVRPGFDNPVVDSQAVFRGVLEALSLPGRAVKIPARVSLPECSGSEAAAQILLALLDSQCRLWLSASLRGSDAEAWLRFHTGCRLETDAAKAQFLWLAAGDEWPSLAELNLGTDENPDESATCLLELDSMHGAAGSGWTLTGPGIPGVQAMPAQGLPEDFEAQWAANHSVFPQGVDVLLTAGDEVVGLPRTTRITRESHPAVQEV